jgi:hypothetical protein
MILLAQWMTFIVDNLKGEFEFFWGSVDTYNLIEFFGPNGLVASLTGTDIANAVGLGGTENRAGNFNFDAYVSFEGSIYFCERSLLFLTQVQASPSKLLLKRFLNLPPCIGLAAVGLLGSGSLLKRRGQTA